SATRRRLERFLNIFEPFLFVACIDDAKNILRIRRMALTIMLKYAACNSSDCQKSVFVPLAAAVSTIQPRAKSP
ncbi:MAG: hypothetical protein WCS95_08880, partial [Lentisphaeria bacterium]